MPYGRRTRGAPQRVAVPALAVRPAHLSPRFDGEGIELWLEFEHRAIRYSMDFDVSREEFAAFVEKTLAFTLILREGVVPKIVLGVLGGI